MVLRVRMIDNFLFQKSEDVAKEDFGEDLNKTMMNMAETMYASNGVGLSAVQVGILKNMMVIETSGTKGMEYYSEYTKIVNPKILSLDEENSEEIESCLSYPELFKKVSRPKAVEVEFFSPFGVKETKTFSGLAATTFLHEYDHFNGITLMSRLTTVGKAMYLKKVSNKINKYVKDRSGIRA